MLERDGRRITLLAQHADTKDWVVQEADVPDEYLIPERELTTNWRRIE
jgi:hypothetical protein